MPAHNDREGEVSFFYLLDRNDMRIPIYEIQYIERNKTEIESQ